MGRKKKVPSLEQVGEKLKELIDHPDINEIVFLANVTIAGEAGEVGRMVLTKGNPSALIYLMESQKVDILTHKNEKN